MSEESGGSNKLLLGCVVAIVVTLGLVCVSGVVVVGGMSMLGNSLESSFSDIENSLENP